VILPIAPIGVMSVSPVARAATIDKRNVTTTASRPIHQVIPKSTWPSTTHAVPARATPTTNHDAGTSMWASSSSIRSRARAPPPPSPPTSPASVPERPLKARSTVRHLKANDKSPLVTIIAVAGQSTQATIPL
jgi:hypothetical protein